MKVQSNIVQDVIWLREHKEGVLRVTLRKNFVQFNNDEEALYEFDEVEVFIKDRDNAVEYCTINFEQLFSLGQMQEMFL